MSDAPPSLPRPVPKPDSAELVIDGEEVPLSHLSPAMRRELEEEARRAREGTGQVKE